MPVYQYKCSCGKEKEEFLPMSEYKKSMLCECGEKMKKIVSAPSLSGFNSLGQSKNGDKES
ncbi:MAG: hypothetical protein S4CHLAM20_04340 [Chlamydiia bacterium]|nr:hypothetical protein [Chlamydiia bacterium]